jgi:hypothetical protein
MNTPSRRAFLGLAQNAVAAAAIGVIGVRFIEAAEAMPIAPDLGQDRGQDLGEARKPSDLLTQAQWGPAPGWGPGPAPGWGRPRPRRRRWVCWWHRGRRHCGWRWR